MGTLRHDCWNLMSCYVQQYLPAGDSPVLDIEKIVHSTMRALAVSRRRRRRSFLPPSPIELLVFTEEGRQLNLIGYQRKGGDFFVELHYRETELRALHTHDGHRNPDPPKTPVKGCHMHFPSTKFPLLYRRSSYAYEISCPDFYEATDSVQFFCTELDIIVDAMQLYL